VKVEAKQRLKDAWRRLRGGELTPARAALSVAIGVAIGVMPLWGLHWLLVLAICLPLRLDAGVAYLAANVSLPFIAPFITTSEIAIGTRIVEGHWPAISPEMVHTIELRSILGALVVGTGVVAVAGALVLGGLTYVVSRTARHIRRSRQDVAR
jgi:uncharacterized protein (DUF2062 family)